MIQKKSILSLALVTLFAINAIYTPTHVSAAPSGYSLIWSDEFNGSSLDTSKWGYQSGTWTGSNVQNCYTANNTALSGGSLLITAKYEPNYACFSQTRDFTSGFIQTKDKHSWTYGYFEVRAKLPDSDSTWPAFWMSPQSNAYGSWPRSGEIDIFEAKGHNLVNVYSDAHWGESSSNKQHRKGTGSVGSITDWHTYAVKWTEGKLEYYIDGAHFHTISNFSAPNATTDPGPFNQPFYLRLNMAVGGDYLTAPYDNANNSIGQLPAVMEVDYARVYAASSAPTSPTTPSSPSDPQAGQPAASTPSSKTNSATPETTAPNSANSTPPPSQTSENTTTDATATTSDNQIIVDDSALPTSDGAQESEAPNKKVALPSIGIRRGTSVVVAASIGVGVPLIASAGVYWGIKRRH